MGGCCCKKKKAAAAVVVKTERTQWDTNPRTEETMSATPSTSSTALTRSTVYSSDDDSLPALPGKKKKRKKRKAGEGVVTSEYENVSAMEAAMKSDDSSVKSFNDFYADKKENSARSGYCLHRERQMRLFTTEIDTTQVPSIYKPTGKKDDKSVSYDY